MIFMFRERPRQSCSEEAVDCSLKAHTTLTGQNHYELYQLQSSFTILQSRPISQMTG